MKTIFTLIVCAIMSILTMSSCDEAEHRKRINCEFHGGIILQKYNFKKEGYGNERYSIQYKGIVYDYVEVYDIDSNYNLGDTINKPCLSN